MENRFLGKNDKVMNYILIPAGIMAKELSSTTLLIYGCILSRSLLSQKNGWIDKDGHVYTRYTAPQLAEDVGRGISTVKASLKELEEKDLIVRKRMGLTMTNIYVKVPSADYLGRNLESKSQDCNISKPDFSKGKVQEIGLSEVRKPDPSKYKRVNKETYHKEYIVREGESF